MGISTGSLARHTAVIGGFVLTLMLNICLVTDTTLWASGVSAGSDAMVMSNDGYGYARSFDAALGNALIALQDSGQVSPASLSDFYDAYTTASTNYSVLISSAADVYESDQATDPVGARQSYVSDIDHARDSFLTSISAAKDQMLSELDGTNTVQARNSFTAQFAVAAGAFSTGIDSFDSEIASLQ